MKVLMVCSYGFKNSPTGAGTQVRETCAYLRKIGVDVRQIFVRFRPVVFEEEDSTPLSHEQLLKLVEKYDVAHLIHCSKEMVVAWRPYVGTIPTLGSTIYWGGFERIAMAVKTFPPGLSMVKAILNFLREMSPLYNDFRGIKVFLPNSHAEAGVVSRYYRRDEESFLFPVPNGFVPPDYDPAMLPRCADIPFDDYIVVPGIFANRKNQLGLIKALRRSDYPVVFLGGRCDYNRALTWFFDRCKALATEKMLFLGHVPSSSERYWSVLAYARCSCLASDCETPGIAMIESSYAGARPVITKFGGTSEYYGFDGEYFDPRSEKAIRSAVGRAWNRGRLTKEQSLAYARFSWRYCAEITLQAYEQALAVWGRGN